MWKIFALLVGFALASKLEDRVTSIPGFGDLSESITFEVYSGYLDVPTTGLQDYDSLRIHYELHTCVGDDCPVAVWHQGGPGGSAIYGAWTRGVDH